MVREGRWERGNKRLLCSPGGSQRAKSPDNAQESGRGKREMGIPVERVLHIGGLGESGNPGRAGGNLNSQAIQRFRNSMRAGGRLE